jgi:hypothetical protein
MLKTWPPLGWTARVQEEHNPPRHQENSPPDSPSPGEPFAPPKEVGTKRTF